MVERGAWFERLPQKVKGLSERKSIDIQRINPEEPDYRRISNYLGKQADLEMIAPYPFNSDLSTQRNQKKLTHYHLPKSRRSATTPGTAPAEKKPASQCVSILSCSDCFIETGASVGSQMKTITSSQPDVEVAMLEEVQKVHRACRDLKGIVVSN